MIAITILILLVCFLLMGIVLIQNSKGGGLASGFSASNQIVGVQRTTDILEKGTWILAVALLVLCLASAAFTGTTEQAEQTSELDGLIQLESVPQGFDAETAPLEGEE